MKRLARAEGFAAKNSGFSPMTAQQSCRLHPGISANRRVAMPLVPIVVTEVVSSLPTQFIAGLLVLLCALASPVPGNKYAATTTTDAELHHISLARYHPREHRHNDRAMLS
jgi:hypothetical protein